MTTTWSPAVSPDSMAMSSAWGRADLDVAHLDRAVGSHRVYECPLRAVLHGRNGRHGNLPQNIEKELGVDELVGKSSSCSFSKIALSLTVPVVGSIRLSTVRSVPVVSLRVAWRSKASTIGCSLGTNELQDGREVVLRDREDHRSRANLSDGYDAAVGVGGMNDVAGIDRSQANASRQRRGDSRVDDLELGGVDLRLVRGDRAFELNDERLLGVVLLPGDGILRRQKPIAREILTGVVEQRAIAVDLSLGLKQLRLEGALVDLGQQAAFLDQLPIFEQDPHELPVDTAFHGHGDQRRDGPETDQVKRKIGAPDR